MKRIPADSSPARILRCLTSEHIFRETGPDGFANNDVSHSLVKNEPLRAYLIMLSVTSRLPHAVSV